MQTNTLVNSNTTAVKKILLFFGLGVAIYTFILFPAWYFSSQALYRILPDQTLDYLQAKSLAGNEFKNSMMSAAWAWDSKTQVETYRLAILSLDNSFNQIDCQRVEDKERNECLLLKRNIVTLKNNVDLLISSTVNNKNDPRLNETKDGLTVIATILK